MSAGKNAIPLVKENPNWKDAGLPGFTCNACGEEGAGCELLCEDDDTTLWCPNCRLADWEWN